MKISNLLASLTLLAITLSGCIYIPYRVAAAPPPVVQTTPPTRVTVPPPTMPIVIYDYPVVYPTYYPWPVFWGIDFGWHGGYGYRAHFGPGRKR